MEKIHWELGDAIDEIIDFWALYEVNGIDDKGNKYIGYIQSCTVNPEINEEYITDIEMI